MELELIRKWPTENATVGELYVDGVFECYTLEDSDRLARGLNKLPGRTAIPQGVYSVVLTDSPRFGRVLPLLVNVPGFEGVRIHPGNTPADTDGCVLPGKIRGPERVGDSRQAFDALFAKLQEAEAQHKKVTISIRQS